MRSSEKRRKRPARKNRSGSDSEQVSTSEPEFLIVGQIVRPHGIRGEVGMKILTSYPERLSQIGTLYVGEEHQPLTVRRMRRHMDGMIILFERIAERNDAEKLRGKTVYIHLKDAVPLGDGEYYLFQIEGIRVITDTGTELGHLRDVIETGANDVYVVTGEDGREILLPAISQVILSVDVPEQVMTVHLLDGLL